ncbi:AfsR/SARP family transcriptional regulator [Streptomyces sp. LZ34]
MIPTGSIIENIWHTGPPDHAVPTLQSYISRLRKLLSGQPLRGGATIDVTYRFPGYVLRSDPRHVDILRFGHVVNSGLSAHRGGDHGAAFTRLTDALRLWTAPPFEDLTGYAFAAREAAWLEQLRLTAVEGRAAAAFALGRSQEILPELEREADCHPTRERLVYELMRAQYRGGRQADALRLFHRTRTRMAEELGADVSPPLRRIHQEILRHEPSLSACWSR